MSLKLDVITKTIIDSQDTPGTKILVAQINVRRDLDGSETVIPFATRQTGLNDQELISAVSRELVRVVVYPGL